MKLGNIFKRKKPSKKAAPKGESRPEGSGRKEKNPPAGGEKPEKKIEGIKPPKIKKESKFKESYRIIKIPHVTERANLLSGKNQYVFKIWPRANKIEVKKAIENIFGVDVISVNIINITGKKRRLGKIEGKTSGYKKAIVRIAAGQKIEVLSR
jgi:large subunit ribosomal protein L23